MYVWPADLFQVTNLALRLKSLPNPGLPRYEEWVAPKFGHSEDKIIRMAELYVCQEWDQDYCI